MIVEVHWWIKDDADTIKRTEAGVDIIDEDNIKFISEFMLQNYGTHSYSLNDCSTNDLIDVMNYLSDKSSYFDFNCLENFQAKINLGIISPLDWGIKCLKFKKKC